MLPRKTWHTVSEDTLQRASAGWVWLHTFMDGRGQGLPIDTRIGDAMMSKWAPPCVILRHNVDGGSIIASMGNRIWAVLGLPLQQTDIDGVAHYKFDLQATVQWHHIVDPEQWDVLPLVAWRDEVQGVVMKAAGSPQALPKHCLQNKKFIIVPVDDSRFAEACWTLAVARPRGADRNGRSPAEVFDNRPRNALLLGGCRLSCQVSRD